MHNLKGEPCQDLTPIRAEYRPEQGAEQGPFQSPRDRPGDQASHKSADQSTHHRGHQPRQHQRRHRRNCHRRSDKRSQKRRKDEQEKEVPRRVDIFQRVIVGVCVPIECLQVLPVRDHRVRLDKPRQYRVVVPRLVVIQPGVDIVILAGIAGVEGEIRV